MTSQDYQECLRSLYDREGVGVARFECRHKEDCCRDVSPRPITFGAEAHVGSSFGKFPRVVVVSLDARGESHGLVQRQAVIEGLDTGLNAHMRGTKLTLEMLLGHQLGGALPWPFFAMTNAAKCSGADGKGDKVPDSLYQRCRPFAVSELGALDPQVVITQGMQARMVVEPIIPVPEADLSKAIDIPGVDDGSHVRSWLKAVAEMYIGLTRVTGKDVITLKTPHPSDRGGRWQVFNRLALPMSSYLVWQLLSNEQQKGMLKDRGSHS